MADSYVLARSYQASARLNLQHWIIKETFGFLLHPAIPALEADWKIADVGTGTGVWITELSRSVPESVICDGFDVSPDQFPHPSALPANTTLRVLDALKPPPEHLHGTYDVVHIRMLFSVIENDNPTNVVQHCLQLLKPGGYLQWDEMDPKAFQARPNSGFPTPCLEALWKMFKTVKSLNWIPKLPEYFEQNKLNIVAVKNYSEQLWQKHMLMEVWCLTAEDLAVRFESLGMSEKATEMKQIATGAYAEIKKGASYEHTWRVNVARVPL